MDFQSADARTDQAARRTPRLDSQLIVRIGQRDEQALGLLYDRYGALVYTIALRITQEKALAETIVEDVFYAVWQAASSFQVGVSVPLWLSQMARQQALAATQPYGHRTRTQVAAHTQARPTHPDQQDAGGAEAPDVRRALDGLPTDQRETVELAYYDRLTCHEIATRLRKPVSLVRTHLRVGLCTLYERLSDAAQNLGQRNL